MCKDMLLPEKVFNLGNVLAHMKAITLYIQSYIETFCQSVALATKFPST